MCHNDKLKQGGLDLTSRDTLLKGSETGPVIVIGKPEDSQLYKLVAHISEPAMPFKGKKLPDDAIAVVQQLLLWLPDDTRLYWLLAELYNADGAPATAARIFDECMDSRGFQTKQLGEHRRLVKEALASQQAAAPDDSKSWTRHPEAFWIVGGVLAIPLMLLVFWQVREIRRRLTGKCRTGH